MALVKDIHEAEVLLWEVIMDALGADKFHTPPLVRRSWNMNGAPDWKINENVVFMQLTEQGADDISQPIDSVLVDKNNDYERHDGLTRVLTLSLVAYGSSSYFNLLKARNILMRGAAGMRRAKIYAIPSAEPIQRVPENFQGRWWERSDLRLRFNCLMEFTEDVNRIAEVSVSIKCNEPGASETVTEQTGIIIKKG